MLLEEEFPELSFEGHMEISQKNVGTCVPAHAHACVCKEPVPRQSGCEQGVGNGTEVPRLQGQVGTLLRDF